MKKILMFLLLSLTLVSCQSTDKVRAFNNFRNHINADIIYHPFTKSKLINDSDFLIIFYPDAIDAHKFAGVLLGMSFSDHDFKMELEQIDKNFNKVNISDSACHKIIPNGIAKIDCLELKLVPNVNDTTLLPKEYIVGESVYYILGYNKGEYLSPSYKNYFENNEKEYHGYTIGVIANKAKKSLVYWLIIV